MSETSTNSAPEADLEDIMPGQIWAEMSQHTGKIKLYVILDVELVSNPSRNAATERAIMLCLSDSTPTAETRLITNYWEENLSIWYDPKYDLPPKNIDFKNLQDIGSIEEISIIGGHEA